MSIKNQGKFVDRINNHFVKEKIFIDILIENKSFASGRHRKPAKKRNRKQIKKLMICLLRFYGISNFVGYLTPNPNNQF